MTPINWRLAGPEVAFIVEDCKAPVLFVGPEFVTVARSLRDKLPGVRTIITTEGGAPEWQDFAAWRDGQSSDDPGVKLETKDIAMQLYTSGTTGKPKGAMILTARHVSAREGLELGFVNEVVPLGEALAAAERWAETIAKNSPMSIRASKQAIQRGLEVSLEQAMAEQREYPAVKAMAASQDYIEGPKAFAEKRPPKWLGR